MLQLKLCQMRLMDFDLLVYLCISYIRYISEPERSGTVCLGPLSEAKCLCYCIYNKHMIIKLAHGVSLKNAGISSQTRTHVQHLKLSTTHQFIINYIHVLLTWETSWKLENAICFSVVSCVLFNSWHHVVVRDPSVWTVSPSHEVLAQAKYCPSKNSSIIQTMAGVRQVTVESKQFEHSRHWI